VLRRWRRQPLRTTLTLLQITLGALAMTLALSLYLGAPVARLAPADNFTLVSGERTESSSISYATFDVERVAQLAELAPDVEVIAFAIPEWELIVAKDGRLYRFIRGAYVDLNYLTLQRLSAVRGALFGESDAAQEASVMLISEGAAAVLFDGADPIGQTLELMPSARFGAMDEAAAPRAVQVIGTFRDPERTDFNAHYAYLPLWLYGAGNFARASSLEVRAVAGRGEAARAQLIAAARQVFADELIAQGRDESNDFYIQESGAFGPQSQSRFNPTVVMFGLFGIVALLVGAIGIFSITVVEVLERERITGIKRALGATRADVVREVALGAALIAGLGGLIGVGAALLIIPLLAEQVGAALFWGVELSGQPLAAFSVLLLTVALGGLLGLFPAMRASRTPPVQALKVG
jgi:ABC-type antimicrobial peptide transport system permease subunit